MFQLEELGKYLTDRWLRKEYRWSSLRFNFVIILLLLTIVIIIIIVIVVIIMLIIIVVIIIKSCQETRGSRWSIPTDPWFIPGQCWHHQIIKYWALLMRRRKRYIINKFYTKFKWFQIGHHQRHHIFSKYGKLESVHFMIKCLYWSLLGEN